MSGLTVTLGFCARQVEDPMISERIQSIDDVKQLFPKNVQEIKQQTGPYLDQSIKAIEAIFDIPADKRTFQNTAKALDDIVARSNIVIKEGAFAVTEYLHPDKEMRDVAHDAVLKISNFFVDNVSNNKQLYQAFKAYVEGNAKKENLTDEQRYYLQEVMDDFKRAGLDLPDEQLEKIKLIKKELSKLSQEFDRAIAEDNRTMTVSHEGLAGLDDEFIQMLKKEDDDNYTLGIDYPTYFMVMEHCAVEDTRKRLYEAFSNRAYPENEKQLKQIISLRDQLAKLLKFDSFASLNLANQMVKTPEHAEQFLEALTKKARIKADQELNEFIRELPASVTICKDGKIKAWDVPYVKTKYKEKHFNVDERKIAEYFPMQQTIDALLDIYHVFMGVSFKEVLISGMWHEDVRLIEVYDKVGTQLGYLFLDLHPRPNKYSHAAHAGVVPAMQLPDGRRVPAVSVVMANFPKPTKDKPSLLMRSDVRTFFHEFGHALHALLGATSLGSFSGTNVKTDFVEMPSQMLEEWLWDKGILKKVTHHYQTGEPLPDEMIDNIITLKRYDSGAHVQSQIVYSLLSLYLYKEGAGKDPYAILYGLLAQINPRIFYGPEYHMYASFGHLTGYGAKYYGYLWSKVFALDLFEMIKKQGLLNPAIGHRYVTEILVPGGSKDPNELLRGFLGREPNQDAFIKDLGL
jgi:thimet oligopeptidase